MLRNVKKGLRANKPGLDGWEAEMRWQGQEAEIGLQGQEIEMME